MATSVQLQKGQSALPAFPLWAKIVLLGLALLELWLVSGQTLFAIGYADQDDRLFLNLANALLSGEWLGAYNKLTLVKGPFYPLWITATFLLGMPLLLAQHLLYIVACAIFIIAIRPIIARHGVLLLIWAILLFNPMSYATWVMNRVMRESIYPALTVLVVAGAVGLLARYDRRSKNLWLWSIFLGLSLSAFWLTREEGVWIIPSVLVIVGFAVVRMQQAQPKRWILLSSICCIIPFCIWLIAVGTVAGLNRDRYGHFTTSEFKSSDFLAAYGALSRVKHAHWKPYYPVPRETRWRIYRISPAFAELAPSLEGYIGAAWTSNGCKQASLCDDIGGGWFTWALRDAVAAAGHHTSAESAANYYRRLAMEINAACVRGQIECEAERSSMMPPWRSEYANPLVNAFIRGVVYFSRFDGFSAHNVPSRGTEESLMLFQHLTGSRMARGKETGNIRISILSGIGKVYQTTIPFLIILALVGYMGSTLKILKSKAVRNLWVINTALLIALVIRLLMLSIIDVTSFPGVNSMYLSPAYPLLLIFATLALAVKSEKPSMSAQDNRKFPSLHHHLSPSAE